MRMPNDPREITISVYQEVCRSFHAVDDFRAKLLGFLPLASGGFFFLLGDALLDPLKRVQIEQHLTAIGIFGFLITLGLFIYELRGIRRCSMLIKLGKRIEEGLGIIGQFRFRSNNTHLKSIPSSLRIDLSVTFAARIIYSTTLGAWFFLIVFSSPYKLWIPGFIFLAPFVISSLILSLVVQSDFRNLDQRYSD